MKTDMPTPKTIKRVWHLIDLQDQVLGRVSSKIASIIMGKHKAYFAPHIDCGDYVIVTNAAGIKLTGKKAGLKTYYSHSNYPSGFKTITFDKQLTKNPSQIITHAVKGMLPNNKLLKSRMKRLKIFVDGNHPYSDKLK
ncbi:50S ribosomal protein L13 [Candidatus Beckwithbacteria bacterium CG23_combo_of_CG06-09_8_20_14_all_34_8]|uniref:Large ribosomal subunit protein uL13 n=1 Tax=Candidatus Beckwithbacteria bacterium CG23_combo_of_CG06-09_8_20_14_all_34_8 TaxID=1974497 RepID=A0A2H0B8R3_9BACT|nr:MAG: 50S ribosomal protein L13 [Candidatus Beckwithbacteria bacterium CG23_combo_of_CG06-09_8_20_14_all_34_8]